jgi:hypothetical protein
MCPRERDVKRDVRLVQEGGRPAMYATPMDILFVATVALITSDGMKRISLAHVAPSKSRGTIPATRRLHEDHLEAA